MNIPNNIEIALNERAKHAEQFLHYDYIVSKWLDENNIKVESYDFHGGVDSIVNPYESIKRILQAIKDA